MAFRRLIAAASFALACAMAQPAPAQDTFTISGRIERVEKDGRVVVGGYRVLVDQDSEVVDQTFRSVSPRELVAGLQVDIDAEETPGGTYARRVHTTMMR